MHARRSESSYGCAVEQAHDESRGERIAGAGAVDRDDLRGRGARDLAAVLVEHRAVGAVGHRDELSALHDLVLEPVHDEQVGLEVEHPRRRGVQREERRLLGRGENDLVRDLELAEHRPFDGPWCQLGVRAGEDGDLVLALHVHVDQGNPGLALALELELDAGGDEPAERLLGERVVPDGADHLHLRAELRRRDRLVCAFAAGVAAELARRDRLAGPRQALHARDEVEVDRPDDGELDGIAEIYAARARTSSCTRRSRFSRRSKRPAQSEPRSGLASNSTAADRPSSARISTASSR